MGRKIEYLTGSLNAIERIRADVASGEIKFYDLPSFPNGIFAEGYKEKCYGFAAAVSGSGNFDYLVVLALRPDVSGFAGEKVIDIDTAAFCFKNDDLKSFSSGAAMFHQNFKDRTTPLSGYTYSLDQTVNQLHSALITTEMPLSASAPQYLNAVSHSIVKFNELLGPQVSGWNRGT